MLTIFEREEQLLVHVCWLQSYSRQQGREKRREGFVGEGQVIRDVWVEREEQLEEECAGGALELEAEKEGSREEDWERRNGKVKVLQEQQRR